TFPISTQLIQPENRSDHKRRSEDAFSGRARMHRSRLTNGLLLQETLLPCHSVLFLVPGGVGMIQEYSSNECRSFDERDAAQGLSLRRHLDPLPGRRSGHIPIPPSYLPTTRRCGTGSSRDRLA